MTRFNVNLASRPFHNNIVYWAAFATCFVLLSAFTAYNAHQYSATGEAIAKWDQVRQSEQEEFASLSNEVVAMTQTVSKLDLKGLNERSSFANRIILSRLFSWSDLFGRLEKVQPENVRLRSIRPVITKEGTEVSLDAMTKDYESLLKFESSLLDSDYFSFVYPVQESMKEGQGEIHFNIAFGYVPEGKRKSGGRGAPAPPPGAPDANTQDTGASAEGTGAGAPEAGAGAPEADANTPGADASAQDAGDAGARAPGAGTQGAAPGAPSPKAPPAAGAGPRARRRKAGP